MLDAGTELLAEDVLDCRELAPGLVAIRLGIPRSAVRRVFRSAFLLGINFCTCVKERGS